MRRVVLIQLSDCYLDSLQEANVSTSQTERNKVVLTVGNLPWKANGSMRLHQDAPAPAASPDDKAECLQTNTVLS